MSNTNNAAHGARTPGGPTGSEVRQLVNSLPQTPKRAILYARVSTDEQAKSGYSLTGQLEALRGFAESEGYEVVEEVSDPGESGAYLERPGLDKVRDLVAAGGVAVFLRRRARPRQRTARPGTRRLSAG